MAKKKKKKKTGKGLSTKGRLFLIVMILLGVVFLPTSMLLMVGMFPTFMAFFLNYRGTGVRASTIAAMNSAGCMPFVFKLWSSGNTFEVSVDILSSAQTIAIMYTAAAFGYMLDFVVTGLVASFLYQKGVRRMRAIKSRQKVIISQWGREVAGTHAIQKEDNEGKGENKTKKKQGDSDGTASD